MSSAYERAREALEELFVEERDALEKASKAAAEARRHRDEAHAELVRTSRYVEHLKGGFAPLEQAMTRAQLAADEEEIARLRQSFKDLSEAFEAAKKELSGAQAAHHEANQPDTVIYSTHANEVSRITKEAGRQRDELKRLIDEKFSERVHADPRQTAGKLAALASYH